MAASVPTTGSDPGRASSHRRGPQSRAGDGLGVEAPVGGVVVLGRAGRAQGEPAHGGIGPVVGKAQGDGEPRPAVGAVDERVARPAVAGSNISARQSSQAAMSGDTNVRTVPRPRLSTMANPLPPCGAIGCGRRRRRSGPAAGPPRPDALMKLSSRSARPSTSMNTPSVSLPTWPARPSSVARRCTKGRNPTPWTTPATRIRRRTGLGRGHAAHAGDPLRRPSVTAASRCIRPKL